MKESYTKDKKTSFVRNNKTSALNFNKSLTDIVDENPAKNRTRKRIPLRRISTTNNPGDLDT